MERIIPGNVNKAIKGILYIVPNFLGDDIAENTIPESSLKEIKRLKHFVGENEKATRKFLKRVSVETAQSELNIYIPDKHSIESDYRVCISWLLQGNDVGLVSDAGCPAIADPGSELIWQAHQNNIIVKPLVGPSSILLALMASGMMGQNFTFHGYLSKDANERKNQILSMERLSESQNSTQIFIETPYKNQLLLRDLIENCKSDTRIGIACDLTLSTEYIQTRFTSEWNVNVPNLQKRPCVFTLYRYGKKK